jgi:hypothetical protein
MLNRQSWRRITVPLAALVGVLAIAPAVPAHAERALFFKETASAFWAPSHTCADGSTVVGTLLVQTTRAFVSPDTDDPAPTARVQFLAVCPDGRSFSWLAAAAPATVTSTDNLRSVSATGSGIAVDNLDGTHKVSFNVAWTGVGSVVTTINAPGSTRKERTATAKGQVVFEDQVLVNGEADHPTRPAPFIRVDIEK